MTLDIAQTSNLWYNVNMLRKNIKISNKFAEEFDKNCASVNAHGFLRYITEVDANNISILDLVGEIGRTIKFDRHYKDKDINLTLDELKSYVIEFYSKYLPQKADEVKSILNNTSPYFTDENGNSTVNFEQVDKDDKRSSNVGQSGRQPYLNVNIYLHGNIDDLRTTAHELAHAISSHHKHIIDLVRSNAPNNEFRKAIHPSFACECIGEIESYIVEKLFNRFLLSKKIYTKKDMLNYQNQQYDTLLSETNLIQEEADILKHLPCPVTQESLQILVDRLSKINNKTLLRRIKLMHDDKKCSSYMFRYVVGRVISELWINKFDACSTKQEKQKMLDNFQKYLDKTHSLYLDDACKKLLGLDFVSSVEVYCLNQINNLKK